MCVSLTAIILVITICSFRLITSSTEDLWKQLGITQHDGTDNIRNSFLNGYFAYVGVKNIPSLAAGNRVAITKDLLTFAKQYVNSKSFQSEYERNRQQYKPVMPETAIRGLADIRKEKMDAVEKQIASTEGIIKNGNAEMKKIMQPILEMHKKNLKDYQDPNSQYINMLYQSQLIKHQNDSLQYEKAVKSWQANYPEDYRQLIKQRLQYYIDVATTVDFTASLKTDGKKMKFVNSTYEAKSNDWKMIYRAGKDVNEVVVDFSRDWLESLNR